jgi:hypothetical protein
MAGGGCSASRGDWRRSDRSGTSDLDLAVVDARGRRAAADGGGGAARDRARGLGFVRGSHRDVAREAANSSRAARSAGTRRGRRAARLGRAARRSNSSELPHGDSGHGDDHKRHERSPHLLARLRDGFTATGRRRRRGTEAAAPRVSTGATRGWRWP